MFNEAVTWKDITTQIEISFTKTLGESDAYLFAGINGAMPSSTINKEYMQKKGYKERTVQNSLLVGLMAANKAVAEVILTNEVQEVVAVGKHIIKFE